MDTSLLVKGKLEGCEIVSVTPQSAGWRYVGFDAYRLARDQHVTLGLHGRELCVVVLSGRVDVSAHGRDWRAIGDRSSVFDDRPPYALYLPDGAGVRIQADSDAEVGVASAPGGGALPPRLIEPASMRRTTRGIGTNQRFVCDILPENEPAEHLLVVEVRTPSSHSSSYPPHKHDIDALPEESALEETYYHRIDPPQGFVFQRVYTDDRSLDQSHAVEDHDVMIVPRGYHPVVVPHGYRSYYLNVMAGPRREWHFRNDPQHEWMLKSEKA
ncbi:MAG TPA: 5-deoxy-glucuronate isomerase [Casimicrobiaceae bacterium]|nr:5-deoxy-glucuronate isomerase [Casimicrobiaceae bacterium]